MWAPVVWNRSIPHHASATFVVPRLMSDLYATIQPRRHAENAQNDALETRTQSEQFKSNFEFKCFRRQCVELATSFVFSSDSFCISYPSTSSSLWCSNSFRPVSDQAVYRCHTKTFGTVLYIEVGRDKVAPWYEMHTSMNQSGKSSVCICSTSRPMT